MATIAAEPNTQIGNGKSETKDPSDLVLEALKKAVKVVEDSNPDTIATGIKNDLGNFLDGLAPAPKDSAPQDKCVDPDDGIATYCHQKKLDLEKARIKYTNAEIAASGALRTARFAWDQAVSQYEFDVANARVALRDAGKAAAKTFEEKSKSDSHSRSHFLYFSGKASVAAAVQGFEKSGATAAATLASAAGSLLTAYGTYVAAINAARSQYLIDETAAEQTFWQNVD